MDGLGELDTGVIAQEIEALGLPALQQLERMV